MAGKVALSGKSQAYSEYKDSGVEWLGEIPNHWHSTKIKYGYEITLGKILQKEAKSSVDELRPYLKAVNIQPFGIYLEQVGRMWFSPAELRNLKLTYGDVLISEGGDVGRSAIWRNELPVCYFQNAINRARPRKNRSPRYLFYWMNTLKSSEFIDILCNKATIAHYTAEKVENSPLFIPSYGEAENIANFLDHETAKIDTLIDKQQQLIQLLKEKRQAVISHAVTKGLNPNASMRDSGVEWLGEVPEHWSVMRLSFALRLQSGDAINSDRIEKNGKYLVYGGNGVRGFTGSYNSEGEYVLIGRQGALCGNINTASGKFFASEHAVVVYPQKSFNNKYLAEILRYMNLGQYSVSAAQPGLSVERINLLKIVLPPLSEQLEIAEVISKENQLYEELSNSCINMIRLLQERRTALISAAVTGKIDVRHWQAPVPTQSKEAV